MAGRRETGLAAVAGLAAGIVTIGVGALVSLLTGPTSDPLVAVGLGVRRRHPAVAEGVRDDELRHQRQARARDQRGRDPARPRGPRRCAGRPPVGVGRDARRPARRGRRARRDRPARRRDVRRAAQRRRDRRRPVHPALPRPALPAPTRLEAHGRPRSGARSCRPRSSRAPSGVVRCSSAARSAPAPAGPRPRRGDLVIPKPTPPRPPSRPAWT